jgi:dihydroorotate dehydrogenase electron transfer subunit
MSSPLHAAYFADRAVQRTASVIENVPLARDTWRVRVRCSEIARIIAPGQFVMLRLGGRNDPLLGRPLALYDLADCGSGQTDCIDLVYAVKGKFTQCLANSVAGQELNIWGPLGNGFPPPSVDHLILVAGGIGYTPFLALAREATGNHRYGEPARRAERCGRVSLCFGARSAESLAPVDDFDRLGVEVQLATEDGTRGHRGLVTDLLVPLLEARGPSRLVMCCGPEPMMKAVAQLAARTETPCLVSLETPMACGIGICFTCVVKVRDRTGGWDYKRSCVEGPVFDATTIEW